MKTAQPTKKRTEKKIKKITILTDIQGIDGWVVDVLYTDNKAIMLQIDRSQAKGFSMLDETLRCIKLQMAGTGG